MAMSEGPLSIEHILASDTGAGDAESLKAPSGGWWCSSNKEHLPTLELVLRPEVPFTLTKLLIMAENENCPKDVEVSLSGVDAPPSHSLAQRVKVPDWERTAACPVEPSIRVPAGEARVLLRLKSNHGDWYHGINILRLFGEEIPNELQEIPRIVTPAALTDQHSSIAGQVSDEEAIEVDHMSGSTDINIPVGSELEMHPIK
jgi:hypothetical protein